MVGRVARGFLLGSALAFPLALFLRATAVMLDLPDLPEALFERVASLLPGALVTRGIDALVAAVRWLDLGPTASVAKALERLMALLAWVLATGALGALIALLPRRRSGVAAAITLLGSLLLAAVALSPFDTRSPGELGGAVLVVALGYQAWSALVSRALDPRSAAAPESDRARVTRRQALIASLAAAVASSGGLFLLSRRRTAEPRIAGAPLDGAGDDGTAPALLVSAFEPAPGTRPEITSVADFYRVDINLTPPVVDAREWRLEVGGLVHAPLTLRYQDLEDEQLHHQWITLECISNPVGGDLISTARVSGVPLRELLESVRLDASARAVRFTCADGYTESLPLASALDPRTLLVVGMNGERLNAEHGFPVRLYTPDRFGMKNPKWLTRVDAVAEEPEGYWVKRGWDQRAQVRTTSVIDTKGRLPSAGGRVALGGIAYAGARGIDRVEVRVDEGPFEEAQLKEPLSPLTWVLWRHDVAVSPGRHLVTVRAWDGSGVAQTAREHKPHPSGATGWHQVEIEV